MRPPPDANWTEYRLPREQCEQEQGIQALNEAPRQRAASAANAELTLLFWGIGHRIRTEVLAG